MRSVRVFDWRAIYTDNLRRSLARAHASTLPLRACRGLTRAGACEKMKIERGAENLRGLEATDHRARTERSHALPTPIWLLCPYFLLCEGAHEHDPFATEHGHTGVVDAPSE